MAAQVPLTVEQNQVIQAQLYSGEKIYWSGRESRKRYLAGRILVIIGALLLAIIGAAITIFVWIANPTILKGSIAGMLPVLIPLVVCLVGIGLAVYKILETVRGGPDLYIVTDQRALIIKQSFSVTTKSYGPDALKSVTRSYPPRGATGSSCYQP